MDSQTIFALDIGTRKIVGLVMKREDDQFTILDSEMIEHSTRAMMDGQIHDVEAVAKTILKIKTALENRLQTTLTSAAVAAAGRALRTAQGQALKKRSVLQEITPDELRALEIEAVQKAQSELAQHDVGNESQTYFCVGYSVIWYRLEDQLLQNLIGQVGSQMETEVIATFLPRVVVDGLFSALKRAGLELLSLTLEPIAALSVAIPPGLRLLNLALVDIGAGTSDIAVVKGGNIIAYAMVPLGGDELTETLAAEYLMDFNSAEMMKRQVGIAEEVELVDILGNRTRLAQEEVQGVIQPVVIEIAGQIAHHILNLNHKAPDAVVCVGGGSLTPTLIPTLAEQMELPRNRAGIRTADGLDVIHCNQDYLLGPQGVTPLGIAYHSFLYPPVPFITVKLNDANIVLWNIGELTVGTALLSSGVALGSIYGRPGLGKTITINGKVRVFPGTIGTAPVITVNGQEASLDTTLHTGDEITFRRGEDGKEAQVAISDLVPLNQGWVRVNQKDISLQPCISLNGKEVPPDTEIPDRARLDYKEAKTVRQVLHKAGVPEHMLKTTTYQYTLNGQVKQIDWIPIQVQLDGRRIAMDETVPWKSEIIYTLLRAHPVLEDILKDLKDSSMRVFVNDVEYQIRGRGPLIRMNGKPVPLSTELESGASITIDQAQHSAVFSDIFQVIDMKPVPSARLVMKVNGQEAGFTTPINADSRIQITWED